MQWYHTAPRHLDGGAEIRFLQPGSVSREVLIICIRLHLIALELFQTPSSLSKAK